jgi:hypothetical protein
MRKFLLFFLVALAALWAQSRLAVDQLRRGSQSPDQLLAIDARGQFYALKLGPGVAIVNGEIRADLPTPVRLTPAPDGSYPAAARISRNGLVQTPGVDYTVANGRIVPSPAWDTEDVVTAF